MTAIRLLQELIVLGFQLQDGGSSIRIHPISQLSSDLAQVVRENKDELLALLRKGVFPAATRPSPKLKTEKDSASTNQPPKPQPASSEAPPCAVCNVPSMDTWEIIRRVAAGEHVPTAEAKPPPVLCARCRPQGYPNCQDCMLANDPTLELINGTLMRTRLPGMPSTHRPKLIGDS
jgi:hypothetical protein